MHHRFCLLLILIVVLIPLANTQPRVNYFKDYQRAEKLYSLENATDATDRQALQLYQRVASNLPISKKNDSIVFDCYLKAGILLQSANKENQSIAAFQNANLVQQRSSLPDSLRFLPYLYAGTDFYTLNNLDSASYYFNLAEQLVNKFPTLSEQQRLFNKKGTMYYETGNYVQSKFYFEKALSVLDTMAAANRYFYVNYKNNIASALRKMQQYQDALNIYQSLLPYNIEKNGILHNIGDAYLGMGDYDKAVEYLTKTSYSNDKKYNDLGYAYLKLNQYDSAEANLQRALTYAPPFRKSTNAGITLTNLGQLYLLQGKAKDALAFYHRAIIQLDPDFNDNHIEKNPQEFIGFHSYFNLFDALAGKANAWYGLFQVTHNTDNLVDAVRTLESAASLANQTQMGYETDEAKLFLSERVQPTYQSYVNWCLRLFEITHYESWLREAIQVAEGSKAAVLQSSLQQLPLSSIKGLSRELVAKERELKSNIARFNLIQNATADTDQARVMEEKILEAEIELSKTHAQLVEQPNYTAIRKSSTIDIASIQQSLQDDEAVLSFYFIDSSFVSFVITDDKITYTYNKDARQVFKLVRDINEFNKTGSGNKSEMNSMTSSLYNVLIKPSSLALAHKDRLIICPHNDLCYLPMEILIDEKGKRLLNQFSIRYLYSMAFLESKDAESDNNKLAAFAPFASNDFSKFGLNVLPASKKEVSSLEGNILIDSAANKKKFIELSAGFGVIHLATHAATNDSIPLESFIAFYPSSDAQASFKLYQPEIYNLNLEHSKLIILSACETGQGKLVNGEGILSLSRAFSYAGCPSIITSLWKADDESTAYICGRLHHYLRKGLSKDEALQKAKLDYLDDRSISNQFKTPRYWAHLVLIGDSGAVYHDSGRAWKLALVFTVVFILLVVGWRYWNKIRPDKRASHNSGDVYLDN